jgi:hypothetical protein
MWCVSLAGAATNEQGNKMLSKPQEIQRMSLEQAEAEVAQLRVALAQAELRLDAIRGCT